MGEYAERLSDGERIKIGTCENMYYLRHDQRALVRALHGNVDPVKDVAELRFRFPWPDEDGTLPGAFDGQFERSLAVGGFAPAGGFEHGSVQFVAQRGYLTSLPCPESPEFLKLALPFPVHRNGFAGAHQLVQQRFVPNVGLVPVLLCGGCGYKYRLEDRAEIEALAVACRAEGDSRDPRERISREFHERQAGHPIDWVPMPSVFWHAIADRILAGIESEVAA